MITDLSLPDTVIALQRLDLLPETRLVVEEAAHLLQEGREMEARALVEKAEAMAGQWSNGSSKPNGIGHGNGNGHGDGNGNGRGGAAMMIGPIAEKLAAGFTGVLTSVLEDVYHQTGDQVYAVAGALEERIRNLEDSLDRTGDFEERLVQLTACHGALEQRVTGIDQAVRDLQPQITTVFDRLDRHTDTLRGLEQRQAQRVSALNQVLENLSRLREPEPDPESALALT